MSALTRQNTLFVAEDWIRVYEALENVDFRAYDFDNLVQAMFRYLQASYPEEYNDWIASSEFITKIEILAWLSQNISFRMDLNTRENFLATAERRDSLIRLAQNIGYKVGRVRSSSGLLKITSIRTNQRIVDSNGTNLQNRNVQWNDPRDEDWFERFILILNAAFTTRTQFGFPLSEFNEGGTRTSQYLLNSTSPETGTYRFSANINGNSLPFDIFNARLNKETGAFDELSPSTSNAYSLFYRLDGRGFGSTESGFFLPFKQGNLTYQDEFLPDPLVLRTFDLQSFNINNDDFFVQQLDGGGNIVADWEKVDTVFGEGVSFNTIAGTLQNVYELDTLVNDQVRIRFGDGTFGNIPVGRFRFWYRTANPTPTTINPRVIQNKNVTIPYTDGGERYQLSINYSLVTPVSNGVTTESDFSIRTRAGKVFYTQNRMVTGQDYNNFFLKDNTIQKVKTVNRTFSGQSRYSRLTDPTSLYQNVKHVAEDGRLYQDFVINVNDYAGDPAVLPVERLINNFVKPLIRQEDKRILYFNQYTEIIFANNYTWTETNQIAGQSLGNVQFGAIPQIVGNAAMGNLQYIDTDSIIRFEDPLGPAIAVDRVIEDGSAPNGVILKDVVETGTAVFSVLPALRNRFSADEEITLENRILQQLDFAISWNQANLAWEFIEADDIDKTSTFSLTNQGDTTGQAQDASWMILFEFRPNDPNDTWRITDRGLSLFFESAREIDFVFSNNEVVIDPETGRATRDSVSLLECNESRDSLRRRGLESLSSGVCEFEAYEFVVEEDPDTGEGVLCYRTQQVPLEPDTTVVLLNGVHQVNGIDYNIVPSTLGYEICFINAPPIGAQVLVYFSSRFRNGLLSVQEFVGDDATDEFNLNVMNVNPNNVIAFIDGVIQNSNLDFGISTAVDGNSSIVFDQVLGTGVVATVFVIGGIDNSVLTKTNHLGNNTLTDFILPSINQTTDTVLVSLDGIVQTLDNYTLIDNGTDTTVRFIVPPGDGVRIRFISVSNSTLAQSNSYSFDADGTTNNFVLSNNTAVSTSGTNLIVTIDGVLQDGPWSANPCWTVTSPNRVQFTSVPPADTKIHMFYLAGVQGIICDTDPIPTDGSGGGGTGGGGGGDEPPPLDVESCVVSWLGQRVNFTPIDVIRHDDGYVNKNGLAIAPEDDDLDGIFDDPFIFKDLVLQDGFTDLVLWRKVQEFGFSIWDPINRFTSPRGTYGNSAQGDFAEGDMFDPTVVSDGDIHYDTLTQTWLIADGITDTWTLAPDQSLFRFRIGRDNLSFIWTHYAPEANRIDPSKSNIMNVYILTSGFDEAYRNWLAGNGPPDEEPVAESSEQLRIQYQDFEEFKPLSDALIYYPSRYKPLFGNQAVPELRATFKVIQTPGSVLSEADLKLRVLAAINTYFEVDRWEFGEKFYFTELVAFVHATLAPDLQSMVIVPRENNQAFGRMFQVRAEPDELFISSASPEDVQIVPFFTDEEIRVGVLS